MVYRVQKRNNLKKKTKYSKKTIDPKTLAIFAKIKCRYEPECKWKSSCWYLHTGKDEKRNPFILETHKTINLNSKNKNEKNEGSSSIEKESGNFASQGIMSGSGKKLTENKYYHCKGIIKYF